MKVAVVGLGVAGLSICARLALAKHDVSGFEQFDHMHTQGSSHGDTRIMRLTPGEGMVYKRLALRSHPIWRNWEGFAGRPLIDWTGGIMAGPQGSPFIKSCVDLMHTPIAPLRGDALHVITRGAMAMPYEYDIIRQDDCGVIAADAVRAFLVRQAPRWGAKLFPNTRIKAPIEGTTLTINGEAQSFDAVIVAGGAWAGTLLPEFAGRLSVKRRVVGWFASPEPRMLPVLCVDNEVGLFGMPAPRGQYKIGLHSVGGAVDDPYNVRDPDEADAEALSAQIRAHFPNHGSKPVRMARCLYTVTPDEHFLIAPSEAHPRVLLFSACSGHGFKYAPAFGELAEEWLNERPSEELKSLALHQRPSGARLGAEKS